MSVFNNYRIQLDARKLDGMLKLGKHIRKEFPIFLNAPHVYLDSAATSHKPQRVIDAVSRFYSTQYGSVHRALHTRSAEATRIYEMGRSRVQHFIGANKPSEIIFTGGTTESINQVAFGFVVPRIKAGGNIVISAMEHHANFLPWQRICTQYGLSLRRIPLTDSGEIDQDIAFSFIDENTLITALVHVSNVLGTVNELNPIIAHAHSLQVPVLVDAAQSIGHMDVNVRALDCDFLAFSGHKMLGPTGVGVLYGRYSYLEQMEPWRFGGEMVLHAGLEQSKFKEPPLRFEGGSPHSAGVAGLIAAIDFLEEAGLSNIHQYSDQLLSHLIDQLQAEEDVHVLADPKERSGLVSFVLKDIHPHDVAGILGESNVAIRAGHHCAQPLLRDLGVPVTNRASIHCYNDEDDIEALMDGIRRVKSYFH